MADEPDEPIVHSDDVRWEEAGDGGLFELRWRRLGRRAGGKEIGCNLVELQPGKTAWPFHYHLGNEEAIFVLDGIGTLRRGDHRHRVRAGDYVAFLPGSDHAHQLTNTGTELLRYLVMSTMRTCDIAVYPDSNKVGLFGGGEVGDAEGEREYVKFLREDAKVGYYDGESAEDEDDEAEDEGDEGELEEKIDREIEEMKKNLGLEGQDIDDLKAKLNDD